MQPAASTQQLMDNIRHLPKHQRKALRRAAARQQASSEQVIPLHLQPTCKVIIICKRTASSDWAKLSCCSDINWDLQSGKITEYAAHHRALFICNRWRDQNIYHEVKVKWRYSQPLLDMRHMRVDDVPQQRRPASAMRQQLASRLNIDELL